MEAPRVALLVLVLFFLFATPDTQLPSPSQQRAHSRRLRGPQEALNSLQNVSYGDFEPLGGKWLNVTGLREEDGYQWDRLLAAKQAARSQLLRARPKNEGLEDEKVKGSDELAFELAAQRVQPLYRNVSGEIRGRFKRLPDGKSNSHVNLTTLGAERVYVTEAFQRNVTEPFGKLSVRLSEQGRDDWRTSKNSSAVRDMDRRIVADVAVVTDSSPGNGWEMKLYGIHFARSGSIVLSTTSEKFSGIYSLPNFVLSESQFNSAKSILNDSLAATVMQLDKARDSRLPFSASPDGAEAGFFIVPSCEYIIYLQQMPISFREGTVGAGQAQELATRIEQELQHPEGAPLPSTPLLVFSAIVFSPDCGFILDSSAIEEDYGLSGPKVEVYWTLTRRLIIAFMLVVGMQIALLKRQMEEASTPSTRSRVAYQSIVIMAYGDGLIISGCVGVMIIEDSASLLIMGTSFLCLVNAVFLEMKFVFDIWSVQVGEPRQRERERQQRAAGPEGTRMNGAATAPPPALDTSSGLTPGLPLPVTAQRPVDTGATPVILPPDQEIETAAAEENPSTAPDRVTTDFRSPSSEFSALYSRFYFSLVVLMFFTLWATSWPQPIRSAYFNILCFVYLSFWLPQIYRNVMRNCRQALKWEYIIGVSVLRLTPVLYCYTKANNTMFMETDVTSGLVLAGWVWLQILALASQQFLGPRLLVKETWCPPAYEYHPILRDDDDIEAGNALPIGFLAAASEAKPRDEDDKDKGSKDVRKVFDCAICMNEIDVPVVSKSRRSEASGIGTSWLERRNYMVTPCRHIFHSECLEGWMRLRLVCPICREGLPPI